MCAHDRKRKNGGNAYMGYAMRRVSSSWASSNLVQVSAREHNGDVHGESVIECIRRSNMRIGCAYRSGGFMLFRSFISENRTKKLLQSCVCGYILLCFVKCVHGRCDQNEIAPWKQPNQSSTKRVKSRSNFWDIKRIKIFS